jgi:hypothetical protein
MRSQTCAGGKSAATKKARRPANLALIPLSTAEKCVSARKKRLLGAGNPIAVSILRPFWQHRPTAEIGRLLLQLAADRQGNLTRVSALPNSAYIEPCQY